MEWELVTKLGMGMGRNGNRLRGNGREWECKKPFPGISRLYICLIRICTDKCDNNLTVVIIVETTAIVIICPIAIA